MSKMLIGHNSVQMPHNGKFAPLPDPRLSRDSMWALRDALLARGKARSFEAMEREQARRERFRYIKQGRIIPFTRCPPQLMVKDDNGNWKPEIKAVVQ